MIKVQKLHYELELALQNIDTDRFSAISVIDRDSYFNQAKDLILENLSFIAEKNISLRNALRELEVKDEELTLVKNTDLYSVYSLPSNYFRILNQDLRAKKGDFEDKIKISVVQSDDIQEMLSNQNTQPSFEWREGYYDEAGNNLYVYHNNAFTPTKFFISYIKNIPDVANVTDVPDGIYINANMERILADRHLEINSPLIKSAIVNIAKILILKDKSRNFQDELTMFLTGQKLLTN